MDHSQDDQQHKSRMPQIGVAIFDNPKDLTSGWACLPGGEVFRFRQPTDLQNYCLWVTSVDGNDFNRLRQMHHLRPSDFFKSKLKNIAADLGISYEGEDWARPAARALADVVHRAGMIASQVYQWDDPTQVLRADRIDEDIRKQLTQPAPVRSHMKGPLLSAYQSYSSPDWGNVYEPDVVTITLRMNRLKYAQRIMATPVPDGAWSYVGSEETPSFSYGLAQALDPDIPCLVEATLETSGSDHEMISLMAFGIQPGKRSGLRSWISQPELQWISEYAKVRISRVYFANGAKPLAERLQLPEMLTADPLWSLSISAGLVAECHWQSIANTIYNARSLQKKDVSVWGVWLRAADRAMCFAMAKKAHKSGFLVRGYGNGSVLLTLPRIRLRELLDFAMDNDVAHPTFREIFERNGLV